MASSSPNYLRLSCSPRIVVRPNIALHITKLSTCRDSARRCSEQKWNSRMSHMWTISCYSILYHTILYYIMISSWNQWPIQETIYWRYLHFFVRLVQGDIPPRYGFIWHSTSSLGTWNGHKMNPTEAVVITLNGTKIPLTHAEIIACIYLKKTQ